MLRELVTKIALHANENIGKWLSDKKWHLFDLNLPWEMKNHQLIWSIYTDN